MIATLIQIKHWRIYFGMTPHCLSRLTPGLASATSFGPARAVTTSGSRLIACRRSAPRSVRAGRETKKFVSWYRSRDPLAGQTPWTSHMKFRVLLALALCVVCAAAQAQTSDRLQKVLSAGVLRVGTTMDTPVFSMRDSNGKLEGIDIDLLETLGPALGVRIEYVKMTFGSMLPDLAADKFDVAMSGMGRTFERARVATFSKPYMRYGKLMMIRATDRQRFMSLADLDQPGMKIAYNQGGLNDRFANTMFKRATPVGFASNELAIADLLAGKVDAEVSDSTAAVYVARQNPQLAAMSPDHVFNPVYVAMLLRREDQTLVNFVNIWIDQIELDGTLAKVRAKWLGDGR
jgi:cyclohexadienyl dehydratase